MNPEQINELIAWKNFGGAFPALDRLIMLGYRSFRLTHVCCVDGFAWAADIKGPYDENLECKPDYAGAGATREEAISSMVVKVLEGWHDGKNP